MKGIVQDNMPKAFDQRIRIHVTWYIFFFLLFGLCHSFVARPPRGGVHFNDEAPTATEMKLSSQTSPADDTPVQITANNNTKSSIFLISLEYTPDDERISKPVRDVWKWKDSILGDGRDFFVPKPKTILALQEYIINNCPTTITEISVISNCARFEVLFKTENAVSEDESEIIVEQISRCLAAQVLSNSNSKLIEDGPNKNMIKQISASILQPFSRSIDMPSIALDEGALDRFESSSTDPATLELFETFASDVRKHWICSQGLEETCRHLSWVAAGIAMRPRRPDRPVPFRPFSSRDAHILLRECFILALV